MRKSPLKTSGFALPTVLIASVVMMVVMIAAVSASLSVKNSIVGQYHDTLARQAARSGLEMAEACLEQNGGTANWTDAAPLRPNSDCSGNVLASESGYVLDRDDMRTSFEVPAPDGPVGDYEISAIGKLELLRKSDHTPWKSLSASLMNKQEPIMSQGALGTASLGASLGCFVAENGDVYCISYDDISPSDFKVNLPSAAESVVVSSHGMTLSSNATDFVDDDGNSACAILKTGEAYCWSSSMIWTADKMPFESPTRIDLPSGTKVSDISVGASNVCFLTTGGKVFCLDNTFSTATPSQISLPKPAVDVSVSPASVFHHQVGLGSSYYGDEWHACALLADGSVSCWDSGPWHQNTENDMPFGFTPSTLSFPAGTRIVQMDSGTNLACFLSSDAEVYCVGTSLADHSLKKITLPADATSVKVSTFGMYNRGVAGGLRNLGYYACANLADDNVYCWGDGDQDDNTGSSDEMPFGYGSMIDFPPNTTIVSMSLAASKACFLSNLGDVYCIDHSGTLTPTKANLPIDSSAVMVSSSISYTRIGSGSDYYGDKFSICAVLIDGRVSCWENPPSFHDTDFMLFYTHPTIVSFPDGAKIQT